MDNQDISQKEIKNNPDVFSQYDLIEKIRSKVLHFATYQYTKGQFLNEGYDEDEKYEINQYVSFNHFSSNLLYDIIRELFQSNKNLSHEEKIEDIFYLIKNYLSETNIIIEQRDKKVSQKDLKFFSFRPVEAIKQSYRMFYFLGFQDFCEEYFSSKLQSSTFEKILTYDLMACEFSSFIDELTVAAIFRNRDKQSKYIESLAGWCFFAKIALFLYIVFLMMSYLIENKDVCVLTSIIVLFFYYLINSKYPAMPLMATTYKQMRNSGLKITSKHALRVTANALKKNVSYPSVLFRILDRAIENKYW